MRAYDPATCAFCENPFMARRDSLKAGMGKFCSKSCQVKAQHKNGTNKAARKAEDHHNWQGGRILGDDGYVRIYVPGYGGGYGNHPLEHRYLMEQKLGRKLDRDEHVHHIDGNRSNNDISNLEVLSASEHAKLHELGVPK